MVWCSPCIDYTFLVALNSESTLFDLLIIPSPFGVLQRGNRKGYPANCVFIIDHLAKVRYTCALEPTVPQSPDHILRLVKAYKQGWLPFFFWYFFLSCLTCIIGNPVKYLHTKPNSRLQLSLNIETLIRCTSNDSNILGHPVKTWFYTLFMYSRVFTYSFRQKDGD